MNMTEQLEQAIEHAEHAVDYAEKLERDCQQTERLHQAIDDAQGIGLCSYAAGCVIAQLIKVIHGPSIHNQLIAHIKHEDNDSRRVADLLDDSHKTALALRGYPRAILVELQDCWDSSSEEEIATTKDRMHQAVNIFYARKYGETSDGPTD